MKRAVLAVLGVALGLSARAHAQEPPLPFTPHPAAVLDPGTFTHSMPVVADPSVDGVSRLRLGPAVLAVAREDLGDVRILDAQDRQWPYVLVENVGHETITLQVAQVQVKPRVSRAELKLPSAPLVLDGLRLSISRELFDRGYSLGARVGDSRYDVLMTGRLRRLAGQQDALEIHFLRSRVDTLDLTVDDGDEAPLPITTAVATAPVADLYLVAPAGQYTLFAGDPQASAPRYEIAGARDRVLAARAGEARGGQLAPSPRHHAPPDPPVEGRERIALWAVIALAVAALGALTLRLARPDRPQEPPGGKQ